MRINAKKINKNKEDNNSIMKIQHFNNIKFAQNQFHLNN